MEFIIVRNQDKVCSFLFTFGQIVPMIVWKTTPHQCEVLLEIWPYHLYYMSVLITSSTIYINGGAHRVTTNNRNAVDHEQRMKKCQDSVLKQQRAGSSQDSGWVSDCNNSLVNKTVLLHNKAKKPIFLFFSTAAIIVELNSWEKGKK